MKRYLFMLLVLSGMIVLSGCATSAYQKAHASYVKAMGPPLLEYSKKDKKLDPEVLKARKKLHKAALKLIEEGENSTMFTPILSIFSSGDNAEVEETEIVETTE